MNTLAAILYNPGFPIDDFMIGLARALKARGLKLGGVVQYNGGICAGACESMELEDLANGRRFAISEARGQNASGCRLDAAGLAAAGGAATAALAHGADLIIVNKFGRQEHLGQGLRQEMAAAVLSGLPVLTAVREDFMPAWREFVGTEWTQLPAELAPVEDWAVALSGAFSSEVATGSRQEKALI